MPVQVTEATFAQEVEASPLPVVLEFYATWCGSCRRVAPTLAGLDEEFASEVRFVTVNAEEEPGLVARFEVVSTPTLFVLAGGERVASVVGAQPEPVLRGLFQTAASARVADGPASGSGCGCGPECGSPAESVPQVLPAPTHAGSARTAAGTAQWVPADACTLPSDEQPARLAEFDGLFRSSLVQVERREPGWLRLRLAGGGGSRDAGLVERRTRELARREAQCCTFFDFTVRREDTGVVLDVRVPEDKVTVLDGLSEQAEATLGARV